MGNSAALVEHEPWGYPLRAKVLDRERGRASRHLLVAAEGQPDVPGGDEVRLEKPFDGFADAGHAALVVEGAAAPDLAAIDECLERRVLPPRRLADGYDVQVRHQHDRILVGLAGPTEQQRMLGEPRQLQPLVQDGVLRLQLGQEPVESRGIDLRRITVRHGWDPDQGLKTLHGPVPDLL